MKGKLHFKPYSVGVVSNLDLKHLKVPIKTLSFYIHFNSPPPSSFLSHCLLNTYLKQEWCKNNIILIPKQTNKKATWPPTHWSNPSPYNPLPNKLLYLPYIKNQYLKLLTKLHFKLYINGFKLNLKLWNLAFKTSDFLNCNKISLNLSFRDDWESLRF